MIAFASVLAWAVPAGAATATSTSNPYLSGSSGYDVSYPNCSETPPSGFAIVGLGGGRPFKTNSCLASEWATAQTSAGTPAPALYFNTGYAGAYSRDIIQSACGIYNGPGLAGISKHDQRTYTTAWEIGCSEAAYADGVAAANGESPSMWWADIETGNSWSTNKIVNQYTVDGLSSEMQKIAPSSGLAGVYSYPASWDKIVGSGFTPTPPFQGDWGPTLTCKGSGFGGATVWIIQGRTSSSGVDTDSGCG
ncbi:MAG: hypothetical protein ACYCST_12765 [Acidimicrobiales bacterium]